MDETCYSDLSGHCVNLEAGMVGELEVIGKHGQ